MTEHIDHAAEAHAWADGRHHQPREFFERPSEAEGAAIATVHALLALVEQQRIANLIALGQFRVGHDDLPHLRYLVVEPKDAYDIQPTAEIREALGL